MAKLLKKIGLFFLTILFAVSIAGIAFAGPPIGPDDSNPPPPEPRPPWPGMVL